MPLALLYRAIIAIRRLLYRLNIKKIHHFKVPVIVVGNITVGGTGKTPLVIWLANFLQHQGFKPGIVSRGYGGKAANYPQEVHRNSDPKIVGDEAVLIARHTQCSMVVDPIRVRAVKKLLAETDCNIVISDDGLQHYALGRNVEIAVIDGERGFGNGWCLPAGPLREPVERLESVDFVVLNGNADKSPLAPLFQRGELKTKLTPYGVNQYSMNLISGDFCQVIQPNILVSAENFRNKTVHAIAGIGNPSRFFQALRKLGLNIVEHDFPDHHPFRAEDFSFVKKDEIVIMTEKDAVKCEKFVDERFFYLPVQAELPPDFSEQILNKIKNT